MRWSKAAPARPSGPTGTLRPTRRLTVNKDNGSESVGRLNCPERVLMTLTFHQMPIDIAAAAGGAIAVPLNAVLLVLHGVKPKTRPRNTTVRRRVVWSSSERTAQLSITGRRKTRLNDFIHGFHPHFPLLTTQEPADKPPVPQPGIYTILIKKGKSILRSLSISFTAYEWLNETHNSSRMSYFAKIELYMYTYW